MGVGARGSTEVGNSFPARQFFRATTIDSARQEMILDYALALDYFTWTYINDQVKYRLLCEESFALAKLMNWTEPVLELLQEPHGQLGAGRVHAYRDQWV